jgi:hypothetical protein
MAAHFRYIMYGLPELARFFLLSNQLHTAGTSLFNHLKPPSLDGLVSRTTTRKDPSFTGLGYDLSYLVRRHKHSRQTLHLVVAALATLLQLQVVRLKLTVPAHAIPRRSGATFSS